MKESGRAAANENDPVLASHSMNKRRRPRRFPGAIKLIELWRSTVCISSSSLATYYYTNISRDRWSGSGLEESIVQRTASHDSRPDNTLHRGSSVSLLSVGIDFPLPGPTLNGLAADWLVDGSFRLMRTNRLARNAVLGALNQSSSNRAAAGIGT
ncbi:hypothetical protein MMC11_005045 [Xylographa trunciseda]|nr:hypothetical protein [Xylographa trunciseda]